MHAIDKKQEFIELRVEGLSLAEIGEKLNISKSTLWHWNQEEEGHIRRLQLINQDELEAEWLADREERIDCLHEITLLCHRRLISYFRQHANALSPKELFLYLNLTRQELDHYRIKPTATPVLSLESGHPARSNVRNLHGEQPLPANCGESQAPVTLDIGPLDFGPTEKPEQNGTVATENGILPFRSAEPSGGETVQNGTNLPQNGTAVPEPSSETGRLGRSDTQNFQGDQTSPENCDESQAPKTMGLGPLDIRPTDKPQQN